MNCNQYSSGNALSRTDQSWVICYRLSEHAQLLHDSNSLCLETVVGDAKFQITYRVRLNGHMGTNFGNELAFLSLSASLTFS